MGQGKPVIAAMILSCTVMGMRPSMNNYVISSD